MINGYILWLIVSQKGNTVFSPQYQDVVAATPHIRCKTWIVVRIVHALWVGLVLAGVIA